MEQIIGPINGFYVASYAWPSIDGAHYSSYAKICSHQPADYWHAQCLFKLFGGEHHATVDAAMATAELAARAQIDDLPWLECSTLGPDLPDPVA